MRLQLNLNSSNTNTVYDGWFELVFESLRNSTDAEENKYLDFFFFLREIFLFYHEIVCYVYSLEWPHPGT